MFTPHKTSAGEETGHGIDWGVGKTPSGKSFYAHSGGSVGGTSQLIVYPDSRVVIALAISLSEATWKERLKPARNNLGLCRVATTKKRHDRSCPFVEFQ